MKVYEILKSLVECKDFRTHTLSGKIIQFIPQKNVEDESVIDSYGVMNNWSGEIMCTLNLDGSLLDIFNKEWLCEEARLDEDLKIIYDAYNIHEDITIIWEEYYSWNGEPVTKEIVGWYHGEPSNEANSKFYGKLKATY